MRIGQVAEEAGVNVQTIRFYEQRGLLRKTRRLSSGYRDYAPDAVQIVQSIKRYKDLGFSLKEIQEFFKLMRSEGASTKDFRGRLEAKVRNLDGRIVALQSIRNELSDCLERCECRDGIPCSGMITLVDGLKKV